MAKTTTIKASSRASVKFGDSYFTIEYTEERTIQPKDDIEEEKEKLWEDVNRERDIQIEDLRQEYIESRRRK